MSSNNGGITNIDVLSVGALYIQGKRFRDIVSALISEDVLEQQEINDLRNILLYLNTTALNQPWILNNDNRNAVLKTAIDLINTRLLYFDGTALTQNWVLNNENRNSVLKTRLDTAETDIDNLETRATTVENKSKYISTSTNAVIPGIPIVTPAYAKIQPFENDRQIRAIDLQCNPDTVITRSFGVPPLGRQTFLRMVGRLTDSLTSPDYNRIEMQTFRLKIEANEINMTCNPFGLDLVSGEVSVAGTINIGAKKDNINIGTEPPDPLNEQNIIIGANALNTKTTTTLRGFLNVDSCEWLLPKTDKITLSTIVAFFPTFGSAPLWLASFALTSAIPNYEYSDVFVMKDAGALLNKSGEVTTTNDAKIKSLVVFNSSLNIARLTPIEGTFVASGTISKTTLNGSIRNSCFLDGNGDNRIVLKHHNINYGDITEWATSEANDNVNVLEIAGNNGILMHQGASTGGASMRFLNSKAGRIELLIGNAGTRASCQSGVQINWMGGFTTQTTIGTKSNLLNAQQNNSRLLVQQNTDAGHVGIEVVKANGANAPQFRTTISDNNIDTHSLTLKPNYTGTTTNAIYLNEGGQLMFNGSLVGSGSGDSGAGGIIYLLSGPTTDVTYTAANLTTITYPMTATYAARASTRVRLGNYNAGTDYNLFNHRGPIPRSSSNPILKGSYEYNPYITYTGNVSAQFFVNVFFYADSLATLSPFEDTLITKNYALALQGGTGFRTVGLNSQTTFIPTNGNGFVLNIRQVTFPFLTYLGSSVTFRCEIVDTDNSIVFYTFPNIVLTSAAGGTQITQTDLTFDAGSVVQVNQGFLWIGTRWRFRLTLVSGSSGCYFSQATAFNSNNMSFRIPHFTGVNFTTQLSINSANRAIIQSLNSSQTLYSLTLPITDYDISIFSNPQIDLLFYFRQPSGATTNHTIDVNFWDGALSHVHTSINTAAAAVPSLAQVMGAGNSAPSTLNMNSNIITNIPFGGLVGTDAIAWNVKNITAGSGITATNNGAGTVTISSTVSSTANNPVLFHVQSGSVAQFLNFTITPPSAIDLRDFVVSVKISMLLGGTSGDFYTFWNCAVNSNTATDDHRQLWTNNVHFNVNALFAASGHFPQQHFAPVFCYTPTVNNQSIVSEWEISLGNTTANDWANAQITTYFRTSVGVINTSGTPAVVSSGNAFQIQNGTICSAVKNNTVGLNNILVYPVGTTGRAYNYKVEMWVKRRNFAS
jgi:hypothetical protein